tara:strand:+ start:991 stop:1323 length:333 start_codon:yes stop_codon:yes gene_type:complete
VSRHDSALAPHPPSNGRAGSPASIVNDDFSNAMLGMEPKKVITTDLPDAEAAMDYQKSRLNDPNTPYCVEHNSCLTHVYDVLRAEGKENVPENSKKLSSARYLRNLENGK